MIGREVWSRLRPLRDDPDLPGPPIVPAPPPSPGEPEPDTSPAPQRTSPDTIQYTDTLYLTAHPLDTLRRRYIGGADQPRPAEVAPLRRHELRVGPLAPGPVSIRVCVEPVETVDLGPRTDEVLGGVAQFLAPREQWSWRGQISGSQLDVEPWSDAPLLCLGGDSYPLIRIGNAGDMLSMTPVIEPMYLDGDLYLVVSLRAWPYSMRKQNLHYVMMQPVTYRVQLSVTGRG